MTDASQAPPFRREDDAAEQGRPPGASPVSTPVAPAPVAPSPADSPQGASSQGAPSRRPDWFHRGHPVFFPLAGFYTGMVGIIVVPGLYAAVVKWIAGYERAEELLPFVVVVLALPLGLLVPARTRRFARYLLLGMFSTLLVVGVVAAGVAWFLYNRDT
ncbi:hypothetical protein KG112_00680 [Nocardioides sp. zg-ZUI104]|uniref:hypothetical protein n=1 Tax=Nocardioides faecalis TaxID=2803858 RepID=UPI001BCFB1AD|nr:hypothetical protein [Nocardioides faecalis]MBS4751318.1 hypothetical protein [Nocardioides faecalis]